VNDTTLVRLAAGPEREGGDNRGAVAPSPAPSPLDANQLAARTMRERVKDKSYRAYPLGQRAGEYLRYKRGRLTPSSYRDYEACLDKLTRDHLDLDIGDFEPPVGTQRLDEFLESRWGARASRTYNKNHSILSDFFQWARMKTLIHGDPMLPIPKHRKRDVHREIFRGDDRSRILADGPSSDHLRRDRIALRLLLQYGLRKGALQAIQFRHFDQSRHRLTIFTKGQKIRELPIPDDAFWDDVAKLMFELEAEPQHYLMQRQRQIWRGYTDTGSRFEYKRYPEHAMGDHGLHDWWYGCLERAGLVPKGTTSGEKMHKARHTAGQAVLDSTGNLKAVQKLLGHSSIQTTADTYTDWDIDQLEQTMREVLGDA